MTWWLRFLSIIASISWDGHFRACTDQVNVCRTLDSPGLAYEDDDLLIKLPPDARKMQMWIIKLWCKWNSSMLPSCKIMQLIITYMCWCVTIWPSIILFCLVGGSDNSQAAKKILLSVWLALDTESCVERSDPLERILLPGSEIESC